MTEKDIRTIEMIASNCNLEKVQRDMLSEIAEKEKKYSWIPVSKKLPEISKVVTVAVVYYANDADTEYPSCYLNKDGIWVMESNNELLCGTYDYDFWVPVAWKEIEPYESEVQE